ncbi:MAG: hypothetical protein AAGE01_19690 [Pseudomonadota bacterium]
MTALGMLKLDPEIRRPLTEQLVDNLEFYVDSGLVADGALPLPAVLGRELKVTPRTICAAYEKLVERGKAHWNGVRCCVGRAA